MSRCDTVPIDQIKVSAFKVPTEVRESDGTLAWDSTTLVLVEAHAAGTTGIGYSYADTATATLIKDKLIGVVCGCDAMSVPRSWLQMVQTIRNLGRPGIASMAISAVDTALWDLKARLLEVPVAVLFGAVRDAVPIYGSGGFTSYTIAGLQKQLGGWAEAGISRVKMKVGRDPDADIERVRAAREAIGPRTELFVDANGAYGRKQALAMADAFADFGVSWFEEPVSSDDLTGLNLLRNRAPPGMDIAAGEYGYDLPYFRRMLEAGSVDVLQADATRCAGFTDFLRVDALCESHCVPLSSHCAPILHLHPCCAALRVRHMEYFHDHVHIATLLFDGVPAPVDGLLHPDLSRPGLGLEFKHADARQYAA
ncbi:MAG: enolase C-terminal domain-like protein [Steroidobacteraceae bacterium]